MLKRFFSKINDFIQWTKKWHVFHVFILLSSLVLIIMDVEIYIETHCIHQYGDYGANFLFHVFSYFIYGFAIIAALVIQIIFFIINWMFHKSLPIRNRFLLYNKIYNGLYCFMFAYTAINIGFLLYTWIYIVLNYFIESFR